MRARIRYRKNSRLGVGKIREIVKYFSMDFPAIKTTEITGLNHNTVDDWYNYIRGVIYEDCEKEKQEKL